jgi:hypothetical protein
MFGIGTYWWPEANLQVRTKFSTPKTTNADELFPHLFKNGTTNRQPYARVDFIPQSGTKNFASVCEYEYILTKMPTFVYPDVFRNLHRSRLSRRPMSWLLPHPLPSPVTVVRKHDWVTHRKIEKERKLYDEGGIGEEPKHTTTRKPGHLYTK